MIWDKMFNQYKKGGGAQFGSLWLNLHGRILIGSPKHNELGEVMPELQKTYYFLKSDRFSQPRDRLKFRQDNLLLTTAREAERPLIAKAAGVGAMVLCLGFGVLGYSKALGDKLTDKIGSSFSAIGLSAHGENRDEERCLALVRDVLPDLKAGQEVSPDNKQKWEKCFTAHEDAMRAEATRLEEEGL